MEERELPVKERILNNLLLVQKILNENAELAITANGMAASVPVVMRMQEVAKGINGMMLEVNKLRGL